MYLPNFNRITKQLDKAVKGLEADILIVEADIEKQEGIIAQAQAATALLMASKRAVSNLRDQLKAITA
jgi:cell division FtsZ-interacting protein ZapD